MRILRNLLLALALVFVSSSSIAEERSPLVESMFQHEKMTAEVTKLYFLLFFGAICDLKIEVSEPLIDYKSKIMYTVERQEFTCLDDKFETFYSILFIFEGVDRIRVKDRIPITPDKANDLFKGYKLHTL